MKHLIHFLFGYEPAVFRDGLLSFDSRPRPWLFILIAILIVGFAYWVYFRPRTRPIKRTTIVLVGLRAALLIVMALLLLRPVIVVSSVIPRSSYVAVLIDNSLSMNLRDMPGGTSRLESVKQNLLTLDGAGKSPFLTHLDERFKTNLYSFAGTLSNLKAPDDLLCEGRASDVAGALDETVKRSAGMPLSAVVIATDGAANVPRDLAATLRELRARNVPVFTVGVGNSTPPPDAELTRLNLPRRVLVGSRVNIEALVSLRGYGATRVLMSVREDGRAIKTEEYALRGNDTQPVNLEVTPATAGTHRYTVEITPLDGELSVENNKREALVEVLPGPLRVLYVEGEPRWELGKIRESLQLNEKNLTLVSLQRTGENKFYRQGIANQQELAAGFPRTEEELFAYQGLILGSVEASFFTADQLRLLDAFVSRRGGGLLALGGRLAFDGGKYKGTPVADLLPLVLDGRSTDVADAFAPVYKPQLTAAGQTHPITRLNEAQALSQKTWTELPPISIAETLTIVKPGATVLLEARKGGGVGVPLLIQQRYGRGQTLAFTATDTWRWRMRMDARSNAHETFWRQLLRYLVSNSPLQTEVSAEQDIYSMDDQGRIVADIRDKRFNPVSDAHVIARVLKPSGAIVEVPLKFTTVNDLNSYAGEFKADELGQHSIDLVGTSSSLGPVNARSSFFVSDLNREAFGSSQNVDLLKHIATETGGKYYPVNGAESLLDDLTYRRTPYSERVTKDLWDMPINFIMIIGLLSAEWFLRKREGLA
jgi:uncharacterized membrane protein